MRHASAVAWNETKPSPCGRFHVDEAGHRIYKPEFRRVLPFHAPGLAPVRTDDGWQFIRPDGQLAFREKFDSAFGFYEDRAAVVVGEKGFHIDEDGQPAYPGSWKWCGNFQSNRSVVQDHKLGFYYIDRAGAVQSGPWTYAGDYREGAAAVMIAWNQWRHIDPAGAFLHPHSFLELDVFHKGWARARDEKGWHHIDKNGREHSSARFKAVEPFYNEWALCRSLDDSVCRVSVGGTAEGIASSLTGDSDRLEEDAIAWWRTIRARQQMAGISLDAVARRRVDYWTGLAVDTFVAIREGRASDPFEYAETQGRADSLAAVLDDYARADWPTIIKHLDVPTRARVADIGGGRGALLQLLHASGHGGPRILVDRAEVVAEVVADDMAVLGIDMFSDDLPEADVYLLTRVLHDWSDQKCLQLLRNIRRAAPVSATAIVVEWDHDAASAELLSTYMAAIGGRERTPADMREILESAGWSLARHTPAPPYVIMEATCS